MPKLWVMAALLGMCACGSGVDGAGGPGDPGDTPQRPAALVLLDELKAIDGIRAQGIGQLADGTSVYELHVTQPMDHTNPDSATFEQRIILRFSGSFVGPTVMLTDGYAIQYWDDATQHLYFTEPTVMLGANQIEVEHRYFAGSIPATPDWSKLDIAQAAADHHRIRTLLAPIFTGAWVATGASKSGMTAMFYRSFYPNDVEATVAYVAPLLQGLEDTRFATRLTQLGTPECRDALTAFQREALGAPRRAAIVAALSAWYGPDSFSLFGENLVYELAIINAPFYFWQYSDPALCADIPTAATPDDVFFKFLDDTVSIPVFTNVGIVSARPYRYQTVTQLGTPLVDVTAIEDLLLYTSSGALDVELPDAPIPSFDGTAIADVANWAAAASTQVLLVYGAYDPWTAGAIDLGHGRDARRFIAPNSNHHATIAALGDVDRASADALLTQWTNVTVDTSYRNALRLQMPERRDLQLIW